MRINAVRNINFKENQTQKSNESQNAILMLRDPNASVKFQQNKEIADKADMFNTNPLTAIGYKLYRTFSMIRDNVSDTTQPEQKLNLIA